MKFATLLIVVDATLSQAERDAVRSEAHTRFSLDVDVRAASELTESALSPDTVLLITASSVPGYVRTAPVPVVVCHPSALYELGMTGGNADVDYGIVGGWAKVEIERPELPLAADLRGLATVVKQACPLGWGRPSATALQVAHLPTQKQEPMWTVFAYDKEAVMPGLVAPHRRAAVLLAPADLNALTDEGWQLAEAAIGWVVHGGAQSDLQEVESGPAVLADGHPTRVLTREEYRDWVEERIAKKIMLRLSAIGLAGVAVIWSVLMYTIQDKVRDGVADAVGESSEKMEKNLGSKISLSVAETLMNNSRISEQVDKAVELKTKDIDGIVGNKIDAFIKQQLDDDKLTAFVKTILADERSTQLLAAAIKDKGDIGGVLLEPIRDQLSGKTEANTEQRVGALQLFVILETDKAVRQTELRRVIEDDSLVNTELYNRALKFFPAYETTAANQDLVDRQLGLLERGDLDIEMTDSIVVYLSALPGTNIESLVNWVKKKPVESDRRWAVVDALAQIEADQPLLELVKLTAENGNQLQNLGWRGLTKLRPDRNFDDDKRRKAIEDVWPRLKHRSSRPRQPMQEERYVDDPFGDEPSFGRDPEFAAQDPYESERRSQFQADERQVLVNLLRADGKDWELVQQLWSKQQKTGQGDNRAPAGKKELLVSAWVACLRSSQTSELSPEQLADFADRLVERVLKESDWPTSFHLADALAFALPHCSESSVQHFLQNYKSECLKKPNSELILGTAHISALAQALRRDIQLGYKYGAQIFKPDSEEATQWGGRLLKALVNAHSSDEEPFDGLAWFGQLLASPDTHQRQYALNVMRLASQLSANDPQDYATITRQNFCARLDDEDVVLSELSKLSADGAAGDSSVAELLSEAKNLLPWLKHDEFTATPLSVGESGAQTSLPIVLDPGGFVWFDFQADGQNRYEIAINGTNSDDLRYVVFDAGKQRRAGGRIAANQPGIAEELAADKNHVGFWSSDPLESYEFQVVLQTRKRAKPVQPGADPAGATRIDTARFVKCEFERAEESQWLKFFGQSGKLYAIETSLLGTNADTEIFVYADSDGNPNLDSILAYNDDDQFEYYDELSDDFDPMGFSENLASRIYWMCPYEGDFLIEIRNLDDEVRDANYELLVNNVEVAGELDLREPESEAALESFGKLYAIRFADEVSEEMLAYAGGFVESEMLDEPYPDEFDAIPPDEMFEEPPDEMFDEPYPDEFDEVPEYGGYITFDAERGAVYRVRSSGWVETEDGLVSLGLSPPLDDHGPSPHLETTYVHALQAGRCQLYVVSENVAGLIKVTKDDPKLAPRKIDLGSSLDAGTNIDLTVEPAGYLAHFEGSRGFARFAAKQGEEYLLSAQLLDGDPPMTFAVFKPSSGRPQLVAADTEQPGWIRWPCDQDGDYYLGFQRQSGGATTILLTRDFE